MASMTMAALVAGTFAAALAPPATAPSSPIPPQPQVCKMVVSAESGSKPFQMCLTRAEWKARSVAESKDANRIICHYQEQPGTRFRSSKLCLPASEWESQRLRERQAIEQIQMRSCVPGAGC